MALMPDRFEDRQNSVTTAALMRGGNNDASDTSAALGIEIERQHSIPDPPSSPGITPPAQTNPPGASEKVTVPAEKVAAAQQTSASTTSLAGSQVATYSGTSGQRLIDITPPDIDTDAKRLAYIKLTAPDGSFVKDFPQDMKDDRAIIESLLKELSSNYQKFSVTALGVSSQEKSQIMPTFGDAFAATFTGKEPTFISISGSLIFDYSGSKQLSWYHAFLNAYEYFLRGSRLAKWRAKLTFTLPDLCTYTGYITSLSTQFTADNDVVIPMQFSMLVTGQTVFKSTVEVQGKTSTKSATSALQTKKPNSTVANALKSIASASRFGTPSLNTIAPAFARTLFSTPTQSTRVSTPIATALIGGLVTSALQKPLTSSVSIGGKIDPREVMYAAQADSFRSSMSSIVKDEVIPSVSSAAKKLEPIAKSFLLEQANNGKPMMGAVNAVVKRNIPGLMGKAYVTPSKLVSTISQNVSDVKLVEVGQRE